MRELSNLNGRAQRIAIVDYGMCNLGSIHNMLRAAGSDGVVTADPAEIEAADKLILPGVGAFDAGMRSLHERDLVSVLDRAVRRHKVPTLGICLGMQLMTYHSEEGGAEGLGWVDAEVIRFDPAKMGRLKVPHMGWNTVRAAKASRLLDDATGEQRFYFVHSYYVRCTDRADVLLTAEYGGSFDAAFERGTVMGVQFHPEKSHRYGMRLLQNFVERY